MNYKTLLLLPAALALGATANAYVGFRLNLAVPLPLYYPAYYPSAGYYYPAPAYAQTVSYEGAPGTRADQVTPAPGPGYVWIAGHWNNVSQRWVWVSGHWEMPPSPSALWVAGHWAQGSTGWVWVDAAWTIGNASAAQPPTPPGAPANSAPQASEPPPAPPSAAVATPSGPTPEAEMTDGTVVEYDPPAPIAEYVPVAPYPDYVWIGGFWGWNGGWVWHAGHYGPRPFRGAAWVSGGWVRGSRGWAWHGGRWH
jgi:WXXGXW repeat (2 copies)